MRGVAGYRIDDGILNENQRKLLDDCILNSNDNLGSGLEWIDTEKSKVYLLQINEIPLHIFGMRSAEVANDNDTKSIGSIWGSNEKQIMEILYSTGIKTYFPYNVKKNTIFVISNNKTYESPIKLSTRVKTPMGNGEIMCIDEAICVELDNDNSILHEFDLLEIEPIREEV